LASLLDTSPLTPCLQGLGVSPAERPSGAAGADGLTRCSTLPLPVSTSAGGGLSAEPSSQL
jgi:hypothetical protein